MVKCCVPSCTNASYRKAPEITFHRFPKDEYLKKQWVNSINRKNWQPNQTTVVCSNHFEPNLLCDRESRRVLAPGAIPTIFPDANLSEENKENVSGIHSLQVPMPVVQPAISMLKLHQPSSSTLSDTVSSSVCSPDKENVSVLCNVEIATPVQVVQPSNLKLHQPSTSTASHTDTSSECRAGSHEEEIVSGSPMQLLLSRKRTALGQIVIQATQPQASISKTHQAVSSSISHSAAVSSICTTSSNLSKDSGETATKLRNRIIKKNRKIKCLQERNRRMKKKVQQFSDVIAELKKKLDEEQMSILSNIPVNSKDFMVRFLKKAQRYTLDKSYPPEIRSFALQLNFYSARAYNYVRNFFNTVLPHPATISRWYKKIDAGPGFTSESLQTLEALSKSCAYKLYVNLSIDEMSIRKEQVWDRGNNIFRGHVDTGTEVSDDSLPLASQALVLMVTAINARWKLPIAYFFIASMSGEQRANIVRMAIELLYDINIFVCGLTFDGAASNISMATVLGCNFNLSNLKPYFIFKEMKVYAFYDPSHMIKLIRNCFGDFNVIIDKNGNHIKFEYLTLLQNLAQKKGLHLGVKIRKAHIHFAKQKMKVRLAAQLFSKSVADALIFCKDVLKLEEFKECSATIYFVNLINDCFDILNSRSTLAPGNKKAICIANIDRIKEFVGIATEYLLNLKFTNGNSVVNSARKTGFIGFVICLHNVMNLFQDLLNSGGIKYLCTYKISQDHLEMFFGKMRSRGGFNDNPNVVQFRTAYKKNLIVNELKLREEGILENSSILNVSSTKNIDTINTNTPNHDQNNMTLTDINERNLYSFIQNILMSPVDEYTGHVTTYIAGFISRRILKNLKCIICQQLIIGEKADFLLSLIDIKDRGGLTYPSKAVIKIVQKCENFLKIHYKKKNYFQFITNFTRDLDNIDLLKKEFIEIDVDHDPNHLYCLLNAIVKLYLDIRCHHMAKIDEISERNYLKKIILFKNK